MGGVAGAVAAGRFHVHQRNGSQVARLGRGHRHPRASHRRQHLRGPHAARRQDARAAARRRRALGHFRRQEDLHVPPPQGRQVVERRAGDGARFPLFAAAISRSADGGRVRLPGLVPGERPPLQHGRKGHQAGRPGRGRAQRAAGGCTALRARRSAARQAGPNRWRRTTTASSSSRSTARNASFAPAKTGDAAAGIEPCKQVLLDFSEVGVQALDDYTIEMQLENPTPFWLELLELSRAAAREPDSASKPTARPPGPTPRTSSPTAPTASPSAASATASGW